jgi:hypothetical protein
MFPVDCVPGGAREIRAEATGGLEILRETSLNLAVDPATGVPVPPQFATLFQSPPPFTVQVNVWLNAVVCKTIIRSRERLILEIILYTLGLFGLLKQVSELAKDT